MISVYLPESCLRLLLHKESARARAYCGKVHSNSHLLAYLRLCSEHWTSYRLQNNNMSAITFPAALVSLPPATRSLCGLLVVSSTLLFVLRLGGRGDSVPSTDGSISAPVGLGAGGDLAFPWMILVPGSVLWYPWTLLTSAFVETNLIEVSHWHQAPVYGHPVLLQGNHPCEWRTDYARLRNQQVNGTVGEDHVDDQISQLRPVLTNRFPPLLVCP
jgi:hypothetical protein